MQVWQELQDVLFWLLVGVMWWQWHSYRAYRLEKTRQRLFEIRDTLFLRALDGETPMNSPAYRLMRDFLNSAIRHAERMSIYRVTRVRAILDKHPDVPRFSDALDKAMRKLDKSERKPLLDALDEAGETLIAHLVYSNLLLNTLVGFARALHLVGHLVKQASSLLSTTKSVMNDDIYLDREDFGATRIAA